MLETIAIILIVLWLLGMVSGYTLGNFIYVLLVIAIVTLPGAVDQRPARLSAHASSRCNARELNARSPSSCVLAPLAHGANSTAPARDSPAPRGSARPSACVRSIGRRRRRRTPATRPQPCASRMTRAAGGRPASRR